MWQATKLVGYDAHFPGRNPLAGDYLDLDAVIKFITRQLELTAGDFDQYAVDASWGLGLINRAQPPTHINCR